MQSTSRQCISSCVVRPLWWNAPLLGMERSNCNQLIRANIYLPLCYFVLQSWRTYNCSKLPIRFATVDIRFCVSWAFVFAIVGTATLHFIPMLHAAVSSASKVQQNSGLQGLSHSSNHIIQIPFSLLFYHCVDCNVASVRSL
jgi:hypothetical protein